jgi:UDP-hydrolysing UDP-N-acetyl-D-glucosamine 2-epimerase
MRKIAIVTGTRAEYGLLYWIIKGINEDPELQLQLIVTGMHLSPEFGLTVKEIEKDGFPVAEKVEMLLSSDTETAISTSMGLGMIGFAKAYERLQPDMLLVLGDRFEILAAVSAALPFRMPVAHIHGGESTEGQMDEAIRHAITKMSHIHFTAAEVYKKKVIQMGEAPENVHCFGAPGLDNIHKLQLYDRQRLFADLAIPDNRPVGVMTYHPVTLEKDAAVGQIQEVLEAISASGDMFWVMTLPNADTGAMTVIEELYAFAERHQERAKVFQSLGQVRYLSLLKYATVMLGNSSSGIIEAPSFKLPVINIGDRQRGRLRSANVIDVAECRADTITDALHKALSPEFKKELQDIRNPYGDGGASDRIIESLKNVSTGDSLIKKQFHDLG